MAIIIEHKTGGPPTGPASGDLASSFPAPEVQAVHETSGPDQLVIGAVADGEFIKRDAGTLVGSAPSGGTPASHAASHENGGGDAVSVAGLSGLLADGQTPLSHAASHLSTGADSVAEFTGASGVSDGLDGLVTKPVMGEEGLFLRGDGTWAAGGGGGIAGPGSSINLGIAVWDGVGGATLADCGIRHYGASATDPAAPAPADGDLYFNTAVMLLMRYDATRAKFLSVETATLWFGRNGNTGAGAFYRGPGNRAYSATQGRTAEFGGTVVSLSYTRSDSDAAVFEITEGPVAIATLASAANSGSDTALDGDFIAGSVIGARNQSGGNTTSNVHGWARIKWRSP